MIPIIKRHVRRINTQIRRIPPHSANKSRLAFSSFRISFVVRASTPRLFERTDPPIYILNVQTRRFSFKKGQPIGNARPRKKLRESPPNVKVRSHDILWLVFSQKEDIKV